MSILTQAWNLTQYHLHKATYDPNAEQFAKDKAAEADQKAAADAAAKKAADDAAKQAQSANVIPTNVTLCLGTPIKLSPTNFFNNDTFNTYLNNVNTKGGPDKTGYVFKTLVDAQANCSKNPNAKGILSWTDNGNLTFWIYDMDISLTSTPLPSGSIAAGIAGHPDIQFIPVMPCTNDDANPNEFNFTRLMGRILSITMKIVTIFLLIVAGLYGASLATNLNLYQVLPIRILYAIYGFLFFWIVIPYVLLYRWWWKGKKPEFYAFIPIIPYKLDNYYAAMLFSWMSYKPDDVIACLQEWQSSQ